MASVSPRRKQTRIIVGAALLVILLAILLWDPFQMRMAPHGNASKNVVYGPPRPTKVPLSPSDQWLATHYPSLLAPGQLQDLYDSLITGYWVPQTGLFLSFPTTVDLRLTQQAATYDEGIVGVLLLKVGDVQKAGKIVAFYEKAWLDAAARSGPRQNVYGLDNFYNGYFSVEGVEKTMHVGPNAWIGLLASRYARRTQDPKALSLALGIAHWMIEKVPHQNGAISMGQIPWNSTPWPKIFSTENNLSTYAFLSDLLKSDHLLPTDRQLIRHERDTIGHWLMTGAYQPQTGTVLRGFHWHGLDTVGAIDSYTWFISSLRPEVVAKNNISPENLIQTASQQFGVIVDNHHGIDCVDQGMADATYQDAVEKQYRDANFLRPERYGHRLIWYEGQSQYVVALQDMAHYAAQQSIKSDGTLTNPELLKKAEAWLAEAKMYTDQMDQVAYQTSEGTGYPEASEGRFYLDGWPAPAPAKDHAAGAVAPLVWRMFVGMGYEPLSDTQLSPVPIKRIKKAADIRWKDPGTELLYGASEEMSVQAWKLYENQNVDGAWRQAKATISLWEEDAKVLEQMKKERVGTYYTFDGTVEGFQRIHDYWALNDVAASYFILAKIADQQKNYDEADGYLNKILDNFMLAQMWDKRGWFWNPVDTIKADYAETYPEHYGDLLAKIPDLPAVPVSLLDKPSDLKPYFAQIKPQ